MEHAKQNETEDSFDSSVEARVGEDDSFNESHPGGHHFKGSISYSQSFAQTQSFAQSKRVSFAESTPLVHEDPNLVVVSYDGQKVSTNTFVKDKTRPKPTKRRRGRIFSGLSVSVQNFGLQTLDMAQQRAMFLSLSLPDLPSFDRKASATLTFLNIQGLTFSVSTLAMPYIVATAGVAGIASIILLGLVSLYTSLIIAECQYKKSKSKPDEPEKRVYSTFIEIGMGVLPDKVGGTIMKIATCSSLLSDVYVFILIGQSTVILTKTALPNITSDYWILIWLALLLPFFAITRVSVLAWISFLSLISFVSVVIILYVTFFTRVSLWSISNIPLPFRWDYVLVGYGIVLNSYNMHWTVPAVEASMSEKEKFKPVLSSGLITNTCLKLLFGTLGALAYGHKTEPSIVNNLSEAKTALYVGMACTLLALYFYFPMGMFVVFEMVDMYFKPLFPVFEGTKIRRLMWIFLSRAIVLLLVVFLAVSLPDFGFVVSIIGCIRGTLVAIVLPCYAHSKLKWKEISILRKGLNIFLVITGVCLGAGGSYFAAKGMAGGAV